MGATTTVSLGCVSRKIKWDLNRKKERNRESGSHLNTKAIYNIFIFYVPLSIRYGLNYQKKRLNGANKLHFLDHHFHPPGIFSHSRFLSRSSARHKMTSLRLSSFFFSLSQIWYEDMRSQWAQFSSVQFEFQEYKREAKNLVGFSPTMDISKTLL